MIDINNLIVIIINKDNIININKVFFIRHIFIFFNLFLKLSCDTLSKHAAAKVIKRVRRIIK
jgi:hypothetical protein